MVLPLLILLTIELVEKFCYLGDMLCAGGGAEEASRTRVRSAWGQFNELAPVLTKRGVSLKLKGKIYDACVQRVLVYGSETWAIKAEDLASLRRAERMMVRRMCGVSLKDRKRSDELLNSLGIECIENKIQRGRLRWFGHVERKEENNWVKKCIKNECDWSGGQRCSEENVEKLCQEGHEGYGYKGGNGTLTVVLGEILLGVRPVLARMPEIPCVSWGHGR